MELSNIENIKENIKIDREMFLCEELMQAANVEMLLDIKAESPADVHSQTLYIVKLRPYVYCFKFVGERYVILYAKLKSFIYFGSIENFYNAWVRDKTWHPDRISMLIAERGLNQALIAKMVSRYSGLSISTVYNTIYSYVDCPNVKVLGALSQILWMPSLMENRGDLALYLLGELVLPKEIVEDIDEYEKTLDGTNPENYITDDLED